MNTFYQLLCQTTFFRKNYRQQKKNVRSTQPKILFSYLFHKRFKLESQQSSIYRLSLNL